jgi:hypothetical protein
MGVTGAILAGAFGAGALGITAVAIPFVTPALRRVCLPFVPATVQQIEHVVQALAHCPRSPVVDLGSGDGRVVSVFK